MSTVLGHVGSPDRLVLGDNTICSRPDVVDLDLRSCCCLQAGQAQCDDRPEEPGESGLWSRSG